MPPAAKGIFRAPEHGSLFSGFCLRRPHFFQRRKGKVPRFRARVTFGRSPKSDQKRCLKPRVSRLPARLGCAENLPPCTTRKPAWHKSSYNESLAVLLSLPLTWWEENIGGPTDFGDYQIAHLPPAAASVGAAQRAAIFRTAHYQRGTWERQRGWDGGNSLRAFLRRGYRGTKGIPKTMGLWRRFCTLLPPWAKGRRAGARNIPSFGGKTNGPSGTPAPTEDQTRVRRYSKVRRCGPSGTPSPTGASVRVQRKTRRRRFPRIRRTGPCIDWGGR